VAIAAAFHVVNGRRRFPVYYRAGDLIMIIIVFRCTRALRVAGNGPGAERRAANRGEGNGKMDFARELMDFDA
jgi:hypothetical protein